MNAYKGKMQAWRKVMAAYRRGDDLKSHAGWLPIHRDQLRAQRSVTSMGELYLVTYWTHPMWPDVKWFVADISALALLYMSEWAEMDCSYFVHGSDLLIWLVAVSDVLQQRQLLHLLQHHSRLLWRFADMSRDLKRASINCCSNLKPMIDLASR